MYADLFLDELTASSMLGQLTVEMHRYIDIFSLPTFILGPSYETTRDVRTMVAGEGLVDLCLYQGHILAVEVGEPSI